MTNFVTSTGLPYLHIRKIPKDKYSMDKLVELGMMDEIVKDFLIEQAKTSTGILFTGKGASGKTTLMNAMIEEIPHDKSVLVIQENEELFTEPIKEDLDTIYLAQKYNLGEVRNLYDWIKS